jgi:heme exporter protein CcmD
MHWFIVEWVRLFEMGGYGKYIWPAYGIALVILLLNIFLPWRDRQDLMKKLK